MPTPRRQSPRPTTPFTEGRHNGEVGIIVQTGPPPTQQAASCAAGEMHLERCSVIAVPFLTDQGARIAVLNRHESNPLNIPASIANSDGT